MQPLDSQEFPEFPPWPGKTCVPARPPDSGGWPPPNLRRNWCSLAFHEPKIKRWHRWHRWHSWHSWQLSTTFHISTDSTEILQGLMQGGLAMSCHVLPSWPLRPVFGTDVLEVAGAPHPSGAPQPMSSMSFLVTWCSHKTSHETLYMYNISGSL